MEKKTSFMSLIYREYCITKKSITGNMVILILMYAICIMYTLSARFGNVAKAVENPALSELIVLMTPTVRIMGVMYSFTLFLVSSECSNADLKNKMWSLYRKTLPAKPFKLAMARVSYQLISFTISIGMSLLYILIDCLISGQSISKGDIGIISSMSFLIVLMVTSITVCVEFMKSNDKGSLMAMGILTVVISVFVSFKKTSEEPMNKKEIQAMFNSFTDYTPLFIALIVILFILETVLLTMLYKRREK